jgi:hypothetical protein
MNDMETGHEYTFKKVEELLNGDKYMLNDKIHTVIDIQYIRCRGKCSS